jgi:hypothetical protein
MGGKAGFELGCHGLSPSQNGNSGGNPFSWAWKHLAKPALSSVSHAAGAAVAGAAALLATGATTLVDAAAFAEGALARAVEDSVRVRLAMRSLAMRAAASLRFGGEVTADFLNPVIATWQSGEKVLFADLKNGSVPIYDSIRLFGDRPLEAATEAVRSGLEAAQEVGEFFDRLPIQLQDVLGVPVEDVLKHLPGFRGLGAG